MTRTPGRRYPRHPANYATVLANGRYHQHAKECDRTPTSSPTPCSAARPLLLTSGFLARRVDQSSSSLRAYKHAARRSQLPRHGETIGQHRICWARTAGVSALPVWFDGSTVQRHATRYSCSAAKRPSATPPPHTFSAPPARHCDTARQTIQLAAPAPTRTGSREPRHMSPQRGLINEQRRLHRSRFPTIAHRLTQRRRAFPSNAAPVEASHRISAAAPAHPAPCAPCCRFANPRPRVVQRPRRPPLSRTPGCHIHAN